MFYGDDFAGGSSYSMASIVVGLVKRGHESHAIIPRTKTKKMRNYLQENGVIVHEAFIPWLVYDSCNHSIFYRVKKAVKAFTYRFFALPFTEHVIDRIIRENGIDIVHIGGAVISSGYMAAKKNSCKVVWHIREYVQEDYALEFLPSINPYEKMQNADALICVSNAVKKKMSSICPNTDVITVYNGIDTSIFYPKNDSAGTSSTTRIMFAGGITELKGTFVALEAVAAVAKVVPIKFDIFGRASNEALERLSVFCSENDLENIVEYKGMAQSIADEYRGHDIQIVASKCEAFGRVTAESMLCGCAVVGADSGGTSELVGEDRGFLFEPGNSTSLAAVLLAVIEDQERSEAIRNKAQHFASKNLDLEEYVDAIESVYLQLFEDKVALNS